jgi:hypothetical protein
MWLCMQTYLTWFRTIWHILELIISWIWLVSRYEVASVILHPPPLLKLRTLQAVSCSHHESCSRSNKFTSYLSLQDKTLTLWGEDDYWEEIKYIKHPISYFWMNQALSYSVLIQPQKAKVVKGIRQNHCIIWGEW